MTKPLTGYELENAILRHEANTDAELIEEFKGLLNRAKQAIERIREVHKPFQFDALSSRRACAECSQINKHGMSIFGIEYPCPTIQALDGDD